MSAPGLPQVLQGRKFWREAGEALQADGFAIQAAETTGKNHIMLRLNRAGVSCGVLLPGTPKNTKHAVRVAVQTARRAARGAQR